MGSVTHRIEATVKALDAGQLKKALALTEGVPKLEKHHQWVAEAARTCLANKDNGKLCKEAIKMARDKVQETTQLPVDDTSIEGLEEYLSPEEPAKSESSSEKTDEELENCEECHVSDAVVKFSEIGESCGDASVIAIIESTLENELTPPEDWVKKMIEITETAGCGKGKYQAVLNKLTSYLESRDSPILEKLDKDA